MLSTLFNLLFAFDKKQGASLCFESLKTQRTPIGSLPYIPMVSNNKRNKLKI